MNSWPSSISEMTLINPLMLLWALLIPLALWVLKVRGQVAVEFSPMALLQEVDSRKQSIRTRLARLPLVLNVVGLLALVVVLARPAELLPVPLVNEGIDILICLDKSSSMRINDMDTKSRRLDLAAEVAKTFVKGRSHDRLGLISFARFPDLTCPLTRDLNALSESIDYVSLVESEGPEDATGIGTALAKGVEVLTRSRAKTKVIVLLTDGAENVATAATPNEIAPIHAAQLCQELGIRVHAITAGRGVRAPDGVYHELNTEQLQLVAEKTKGRYFNADDPMSLARAFHDIDQLEKTIIEEPRFFIRDCYLGLLISGIGLVLLSRILRATVLGVLP